MEAEAWGVVTRNLQIIFQLIALFGQALVPLVPGMPDEWRVFCHAFIGCCSSASAVIGHYYNPNGTPAEIPYNPAAKVMTVEVPDQPATAPVAPQAVGTTTTTTTTVEESKKETP